MEIPSPLDEEEIDHMSVDMTFVVPSTRDGDNLTADQFDDRIEYTEKWFAETFGGKTTIRGKGGWVDGDDELVHEPVAVVEASSTLDDYLDNRTDLGQFIKERRENWGQDVIMYTIDGATFFYPDQDWLEGDKMPARIVDAVPEGSAVSD